MKKRLPNAPSQVHMKGNFNIVEDRQLFEESNILKCSGDAQRGILMGLQVGDISVFKEDTATGGFEDSGKQIKYRGLAGSVRSDQADQLTLADLDAVVFQGNDATESFF